MWHVSFLFLWLLVFIMPWEGNFAISGLTTLSQMLGICAFLATLVYVFVSGRLRFSFALVWVALFIGWCFASSQWELIPGMAMQRSLTFAQLLTFVWIICELADNPKRLKWLMRAYVLGTAMMIGNLYLSYVHAGVALNVESEVRFTAEGVDANGLAFLSAVSILFAFHLLTRRERSGFELPNWFYWGFIVAAGLAIPLTGSRAGLLSAGIAAFVILGRLKGLTWKARLGLVASGGLVAILASRLVASSTFNRISEGMSSNTFLERWNAWVYGLRAWASTPFLGVGSGSYPEAMVRLGYRRMVAHNTFISVLVETGLVGFTLYLLFWGILIRRLALLPKADRFFWLGVIVAFLPAMLSGSTEYWKFFWFLGATLLCQEMNYKAVAASRRRMPILPPRDAGPPIRLPRPRPL